VTKSFESLAGFAGFLTGGVVEMEHSKHHALVQVSAARYERAFSGLTTYPPDLPIVGLSGLARRSDVGFTCSAGRSLLGTFGHCKRCQTGGGFWMIA
jgi:hypothetical protein